MSRKAAGGWSGPAPPLPRSIWVVAWGSLTSQVLLLVDRGVALDNSVGVALSVAVGALVVGCVSSGVVRARTVRSTLALVVLGLGAVAELVGFLSYPAEGVLDTPLVLVTVVVFGAMVAFRRSDWYAWQRTRPPGDAGAPVGRLIALGVLVGLLGGMVAPADAGLDVRLSVTAPNGRLAEDVSC